MYEMDSNELANQLIDEAHQKDLAEKERIAREKEAMEISVQLENERQNNLTFEQKELELLRTKITEVQQIMKDLQKVGYGIFNIDIDTHAMNKDYEDIANRINCQSIGMSCGIEELAQALGKETVQEDDTLRFVTHSMCFYQIGDTEPSQLIFKKKGENYE